MVSITRITTGTILAVTLLLLAVSFTFLVYSPESEARPVVEWVPASVDLELQQDTSETVIVEFTPDTNFKDVSVEIAPHIASFVQVSPDSFSRLTKGKTYTLEVTASASELGQFQGVIKLKGIKQQKKHYYFSRFISYCWQKFAWWDKDKGYAKRKTVSKPLNINLTITAQHIIPEITWEPESLDITLMAGESTTTEVMFVASEDVEDVEVVVSPELAEFVSTFPMYFPLIKAGEVLSLSINFSAPADQLPDEIEGSLFLNSDLDSLPKTLLVKVKILPKESPGKRIIIASEEVSLIVPEYMMVQESENYDDKGTININISEPSTFTDGNHSNLGLGILIIDLSKDIGPNASIYEYLSSVSQVNHPNAWQRNEVIGGREFTFAYDVGTGRIDYITRIDQNRILYVVSGSQSSLTEEEIQNILSTLELLDWEATR